MQTASLLQKMSTSGCHPLKIRTNFNIPWKRKEEFLPARLFLTSSRHSGKAFSIRISLLCFGSSGGIISDMATWQRQGVSPSPSRAMLTYLQRSTARFKGSSGIQGCLQRACPRYCDLQYPHAWANIRIGDLPLVPDWEEVPELRLFTRMFIKLRLQLDLVTASEIHCSLQTSTNVCRCFRFNVIVPSALLTCVYKVILFTDATKSSWA